MPSTPRVAGAWRVLTGVSVLLLGIAPAAYALRIVNYNITNYPAHSDVRNPRFRIVTAPLLADVMVVQEMTSTVGLDSFRTRVLNFNEPGQWAAAPWFNGNDTDNALFYKPAKVQVLGAWAWYPNPATNLRYVSVWRLKPVGYTASAAEFRIYSCHLKASPGFEGDRFAEAVGIRDSMNAMPPGTHAILCGDFNLYSGVVAEEPAFNRFLEPEADNDGRLYDPTGVGFVHWDNAGGYALIHTQCPCLTCPTGLGFSGGGMDSRFDFLLPTLNFNNGTGLELVSASYKPVGNDGLHFNKNINDPPVIPEGQVYADALWGASDHLPVRIDLQLPAKIVVASTLPFGTVIVGATASQPILVSNSALAPADGLDYSFSADPGFGAPGGGFNLPPGAAAPSTITMNTAVEGIESGQLHITSDAVDSPVTNVALSGTVLKHATASLDSLTIVLDDTLDLGDHQAGHFADGQANVHNFGYDALAARLSVTSGTITGGAGRFSLVGGFAPGLVAGVSQPYAIHFDDTSATLDSAYFATLTFASEDEPLPGALAQPPLAVTLRARVLHPTDTVATVLPTRTRLYAPYPNPPAARGTTVRFDLAQPADVRLEVFDVAGRRMARLAAQSFLPGEHRIRWDGRGEDGRVLGSGVYFIRMLSPSIPTQTVRVTLVR